MDYQGQAKLQQILQEEVIEDGFQAPLSSPVICKARMAARIDDAEMEMYDSEEDEGEQPEQDMRISQELSELLQQSVPRAGAGIPFFMHPSNPAPEEKKPKGLLTKLLKYLTLQPKEQEDEPLFPSELFPQPAPKEVAKVSKVRRTSSAEPIKIRAGNKLIATPSLDEMAKMEQQAEETVVDLECILQHKYRECMRQARTMVGVSYAQLKDLLEASPVPVDVNRFGDGLYLLPLNELGQGFLMRGRKAKVSIGRNDMQLFNAKSRVVSRHQCQIFFQLNKVYLNQH